MQDVRREHYRVFGVGFPYWYAIGQLKQESRCRDVISRDGVGSQGVAQITYRVWQKYLDDNDVVEIKSIENQLRAQALIMKQCKKQAYSSHLWTAYQVYNGGPLVNKEISRARAALHVREVPHDTARKYCKRRTITFLDGTKLNACDINYEYPEQIYKYAQQYKLFSDGSYIFW
ncbi:hypothetical protein [Sulfurimonas sp. HSL-1716]|uniref:hypothetical protein n=1 Tax=Hydrocurvibacter sulfurireducens TaxID=3131937 RepID=UPI0031F8658B